MKTILSSLAVLVLLNVYGQSETKRFLAPYQPENSHKETIDFVLKSPSPCPSSDEATIGLVDCDDIGTPAFTAANVTATLDSETGVTAPSSTGCGNLTSLGSWHQYDLSAGVEQLLVAYNGGFAAAGGFSKLYMAFFQGPDCSNLTEIDCQQVIERVMGNLLVSDLTVSGLDDSQSLWVYTYGNKAWDVDFDFVGTGPPPANDECSGAISSATGCTLGATPADTWTGPTANGETCTGGTWYSNENTVFYTFTATSTAGSISVDNLQCNDGTAGEAQFGVWNNCGSVGTYGGDFLGCAVGSGTLNLPALTIGNSYIIAVDGQAGDACAWDFLTSGVTLPVEMKDFKGINQNDYNRIDWITASERNSDYFILERSNDGINFEFVEQVDALGNSIDLAEYVSFDYDFEPGMNYYRLVQYDLDGKKDIYGPIAINNNSDDLIVITPNPAVEKMTIHFDSKVLKTDVLQVKDMSGRIIETVSVLEANYNKVSIDVADYQSGVYFVNLVKDSGIVEQHKVVVR